MGESAEERKEREERELKYWEVMAKAKYDKEASYERLIVYMAAGAISVLLAIIEYKDDLVDTYYILPALVLLVLTLIFAITGIALSVKAHDKVLEGNSDCKNFWGKLPNYFFWGVYALLVAGIIVVSLFIYSNLGVK